jgi:hypothetical protein
MHLVRPSKHENKELRMVISHQLFGKVYIVHRDMRTNKFDLIKVFKKPSK